MSVQLTAWECIGCGRIEGAQPCVGVCQDRKINLVYASDHEEVLAQLAGLRTQMEELKAIVRRLACTMPRDGEWETSYRALHERAQRALRMQAVNAPFRAARVCSS